MNASEWREVPGYGQRGVDILADLEAAEKARDKWEVQAERNRDVADKQYARAEKAEADFDSEREACAAAVRQWNKAEAERDRYDMALQSLTPGGSEFVHDPERCVETVRALRRGEHEAAVKYAVRVKELEAERDEWEAAYKEAMKRGDGIATEAHENCDRMQAERDALKDELADYKEAWEYHDMFERVITCWDQTEALDKLAIVNARIRARREKEAGR
jgi:hypothetical protein